MTPRERTNYLIINGSRRLRIARGSGTSVQEVNQLLKRYAQARKMMKQFTKMGEKGFGRGRSSLLFIMVIIYMEWWNDETME